MPPHSIKQVNAPFVTLAWWLQHISFLKYEEVVKAGKFLMLDRSRKVRIVGESTREQLDTHAQKVQAGGKSVDSRSIASKGRQLS